MFSEALKMMDDNMYQYMVDQHMALVKETERNDSGAAGRNPEPTSGNPKF